MVTASVEMDLTLGNDTMTMNWNSILVITHGNVTLLCATSFKEEAMFKLCIRLGQDHQEGVFCLLDTKMVLVFLSDSYMMATMCYLAVAMVWHGKSIKLHIWPLMSMHVRDYIIKMSSHPMGHRCLSRVWGGYPTSPQWVHPDGGPWPELMRNVWDLNDDQIREALYALQMETAKR